MGPEDPGRKRGFPFADFEFLLSPGTEDLRPSPQSRAATRAAMRPSGGRKTRARLSIRDRKSTRLNSSHGYISYAVFCLKKKKKLIITVNYRHQLPQGLRLNSHRAT